MVQMQGDTPQAERGVPEVRRSECQGGSTLQMGRFQQPGYGMSGPFNSSGLSAGILAAPHLSMSLS